MPLPPQVSNFTKFIGVRTVIAACLLSTLWATSANAADMIVSAGASTTASQIWTPVIYADVAGERRPIGSFVWQPVASLGVVAARDERADLDHTVWVGGAGIRLIDWWKRAYFSFPVCYASGDTAALSSRGQFISSLGWEGERAVWTLRHISNGNFYGGKNLGETMLLLGLRF